jgi:hypothetical protein
LRPPFVAADSKLGFLHRIGICLKCMRQSFLACLSAWSLTLALNVLASTSGYHVSRLVFLVPAACTALWLLHLTAFAARAAAGAAKSHEGQGLPTDVRSSGRRAFISVFARAFAGVTLAMAVPGMALAWGECAGRLRCAFTHCSDTGVYCCPPEYPVLSGCDCRCYASARDVRQTGCNVTNHCSSDF